jgi:hypothetical protein
MSCPTPTVSVSRQLGTARVRVGSSWRRSNSRTSIKAAGILGRQSQFTAPRRGSNHKHAWMWFVAAASAGPTGLPGPSRNRPRRGILQYLIAPEASRRPDLRSAHVRAAPDDITSGLPRTHAYARPTRLGSALSSDRLAVRNSDGTEPHHAGSMDASHTHGSGQGQGESRHRPVPDRPVLPPRVCKAQELAAFSDTSEASARRAAMSRAPDRSPRDVVVVIAVVIADVPCFVVPEEGVGRKVPSEGINPHGVDARVVAIEVDHERKADRSSMPRSHAANQTRPDLHPTMSRPRGFFLSILGRGGGSVPTCVRLSCQRRRRVTAVPC